MFLLSAQLKIYTARSSGTVIGIDASVLDRYFGEASALTRRRRHCAGWLLGKRILPTG